jgi:hypothetical protein
MVVEATQMQLFGKFYNSRAFGQHILNFDIIFLSIFFSGQWIAVTEYAKTCPKFRNL